MTAPVRTDNMVVSHAELVAKIEEKTAKQGPIFNEIAEDQGFNWHILQTWPNHEGIAAAHLIARRFGVYLPYFTIRWRDKFNNDRSYLKCLFPGYLFVFVQDIMQRKRRIESCPGVTHIVHAAGQPAIVPDEIIDHLQIEEFKEERARLPRKRRKKRQKEIHLEDGPIRIAVLGTLDDEARNLVLASALGLRL